MAPVRSASWIRLFAAAALLVSLVYCHSLRHPFTRDDSAHFANHARWERPLAQWGDHFGEEFWAQGSRSGLYRPLTALTIQAQLAAGGTLPKEPGDPAPLALRIGNLALLAAAAASAGWLASRLGAPQGAATLLTLLVAAHPLLSEDALEIVSRSETQAALGVLLAARWLVPQRAASGEHELSWSRSALAGLAFLFALGSKEGAFAAFPALLLLARGALRPAMALGAALLVALVGRVEVFGDLVGFDPAQTAFVDNPLIDAPAATRALTGIAVLGRQLAQFVWPKTLSVDWSFAAVTPIESPADPWFLAGAAALLIGAVALLAAWRRGARAEAFGLLLAGGSWLLVSNLLRPVGTVMGERLFTLPAIGLLIACCGALARGRKLAAGLGLVAVGALGGRTFVRAADWSDGLVLYSAAERAAPRSARVQATLAHLLLVRGQPKLAADHAEQATLLLPEYGKAHAELALALVQLGAPGASAAHLWLAAHAPLASSDVVAQSAAARALVVGQERVRLEFVRRSRELAARHPDSPLYAELAREAERVERGER